MRSWVIGAGTCPFLTSTFLRARMPRSTSGAATGGEAGEEGGRGARAGREGGGEGGGSCQACSGPRRDHAHFLLVDLPQLDRLVVGREEEERPRPSLAPPDLVDPLLDLKALEVVELRLVALELTIEAVLNVLPARSKGVAGGRAMVLCSSLQGLQASA